MVSSSLACSWFARIFTVVVVVFFRVVVGTVVAFIFSVVVVGCFLRVVVVVFLTVVVSVVRVVGSAVGVGSVVEVVSCQGMVVVVSVVEVGSIVDGVACVAKAGDSIRVVGVVDASGSSVVFKVSFVFSCADARMDAIISSVMSVMLRRWRVGFCVAAFRLIFWLPTGIAGW